MKDETKKYSRRIRRNFRVALAKRDLKISDVAEGHGINAVRINQLLRAGNMTLRSMLELARAASIPLENLIAPVDDEVTSDE